MITKNVTEFMKNIFPILENTIKQGEPINIKTKEGNAVIISEQNYNELIESLYLSSNTKTKQQIIEGLNTPLDDCISEDEVQW